MTTESLKKKLEESGLFIMRPEFVDKFAECAANSNIDHPLYVHFFGGKNNLLLLKEFFKVVLKCAESEGGVIVSDSDKVLGVAAYMLPKFKGFTLQSFIKNGGLKVLFKMGIFSALRIIKYENFCMRIKKQYTNHQDLYLYSLTIRQKYEGNGLVSTLIRPAIKYCNEEQKMCFVETQIFRNVPVMQQFGFELISNSDLPNAGFPHYALLKR